MAYFYYTKTVLGKFSPRMSADYPLFRTAEGEKRVNIQIVSLTEEEARLDLFSLAKLYPLTSNASFAIAAE